MIKAKIDKTQQNRKFMLSGFWNDMVKHMMSESSKLTQKECKSRYAYLPNPSARAGYDTRSIFKWSLTGLNSEFSFS